MGERAERSERVSQISMPPERSYVVIARNFVGDVAAEESWISASRLDDLRLAVSEAVTNAIVAESEHGVQEQILIRCLADDAQFEVRIRDHAGGFDAPSVAVPVPEPDPAREGGFGLPLMSALVDEASFEVSDDGTEVCLTLRRVVETDASSGV